MLLRSLCLSALIGAALAGCTGGGGAVATVQASCPDGASFCLTSCNLGCAGGGCTVSEIAQNQPLILEFSKLIDAGSVNAATLSIRTASGEAPTGSIRVEGNKITFTPEIRVSAGTTRFGFQAGKIYQIALPGGPGAPLSIRSVSGDPIHAAVNCTVRVSQGIVDLDQSPPEGTLVAPTAVNDVPRQITMVVEFGELIDTSAFQGSSTEFSPIRYELRQPLRDQNGDLIPDPDTGLPIINPAFTPVRIEGVPRAVVNPVTQEVTVSLTPVIDLPSESWVEISVTNQVRDLSGRQAIPAVFRFFTRFEVIPDADVTEIFERGSNLDTTASSGTWGNFQAVGGAIGGDGRHGILSGDTFFDVVSPNRVMEQMELPVNHRLWDTDNTVIPAELTLSGQEEVVTDGRYFFTEFTLDRNLILEFVGSKPAQIFVRGSVDISGTIRANGTTIAPFRARPSTSIGPISGQPGADALAGTLGRVGGGSGGGGADSANGAGNQPRFNGQDGEDVQLLAGHAYASRAIGTGGKASVQYPASGLGTDVTFVALFGLRSGMVGAGAGGGGYFEPGGAGRALSSSTGAGDLGPPSVGGRAINLFADVQGSLPPGTSSLDHFTIGGSGGGGGGSHPFLGASANLMSAPDAVWMAGVAGAPGGGALVIRAGGTIRIRPTGIVEARGGNGRAFTTSRDNYGMPGGGGSGGSILIQTDVADGLQQEGLLDTSGGTGSTISSALPSGSATGGAGSRGFIRIETPGGGPVDAGVTVPLLSTRNFGTLTDLDPSVGARSRWYSTRQFFSPEFLRYEIEAEIDGVPVLYSDDPAVSNIAADDPTAPIYALFQAAEVNFTTREATAETIGPWRRYVGADSGRPVDETLNQDDGTGFRFTLIYNRDVTSDIVVTRVTVVFRS